MADKNSVIREKRGQAFWITINRPDKRNAINGDVVAGIAKGYRDAHDDKNVRVIVLTGAGGVTRCVAPALTCRTPGPRSRWILPSRMSIMLTCCGCRRSPPSRRSRGWAGSA